ncbi:LANO_0E07976g1_1 [Lachancea nothofagi CBS 11611]|uniref:LANO_0E07976g1_1 n=1 Tax=Lachancea nothofagi CBS 11611 TaxID=1266666 RepID=A0A1G4JUU7_9SACH|nr:LANO_0E07976g1_1 [Lachancea nothofagi CBS 11611]
MRALRFNQDATCCSVAMSSSSLCIYNCDPFGKCFELENGSRTSSRDDLSGFQSATESNFIVEMLFSTSLIVVVDKNLGSQKSRKLKIVNTKRKSTICELTFPHEIEDVVMNRKRMCVLLSSDQIFIYDISCMKLLQTIDVLEGKLDLRSSSGKSNTHGMGTSSSSVRMALSSDDSSTLCYSTFSRSAKENGVFNDIVVFDALNVTPINYLNSVHKNSVSCLAVTHHGKLVATASERGTIVRIFQTGADTEYDGNEPLFREFRRGTRPTVIYEMKFNQGSTLLGCVGDTDTIHVFKLSQGLEIDTVRSSDSRDTWMESRLAKDSPKQLASFLSKKVISRIPSQSMARDFAFMKVDEGVKHCIGFPEEFPNQVYVAGNDGVLQIYELPTEHGECILLKNSKF